MKLAGMIGAARAAINSSFDADWRHARSWVRQGFKLPKAEFERAQLGRLTELLSHYRALGLADLWLSDSAPQSYEELPRLGQTDRLAFRSFAERLRPLYAGRQLREDFTSGTSGIRVPILSDKRTASLNEAHRLELELLAGAQPAMPVICLWAMNEALGLPGPPRGRLSHYFYPRVQFNGFSGDADTHRQLYETALKMRSAMLIGYAGALAECAGTMLRNGWLLPPGHVITGWTSAEALSPQRRAAIRQAFGFNPHEMYGCREAHWVAMECEQGRLHSSMRHIVEVVDEDSGERLPEGEVGRILITDLHNEVTPVVRYGLGDRGSIAWEECSCGRSGFIMRSLDGRDSDLLRFPSGKTLHSIALTWTMRWAPSIVQWQLVRREAERFELIYSGHDVQPGEAAQVESKLRELFSEVSFSMRQVERVPKTAGGKISYFIDETLSQPATVL